MRGWLVTYPNLDVLGSTIDRAIRSGLALVDAERRLDVWEEFTRVSAIPAGIGEERVAQAAANVELHQRFVRVALATVNAVPLEAP